MMIIIAAMLGFVAGVGVAVIFPLGLYFSRLMYRLRGPVEFEIDGKTMMMGPDDVLHWDFPERSAADLPGNHLANNPKPNP